MRRASSSVGRSLKTLGRRGVDRLHGGSLKSVAALAFLRRPGRFVTLSASVTAMGLTVGMAVAGNGGPGFQTRQVPCDSAPAVLKIGCEGAGQVSGVRDDSRQTDWDATGDTPPISAPGGLVVTDDQPATSGTGGTTIPSGGHDSGNGNNSNGNGNDDDDDDGNDHGDGDGNGDGNGDGDGDGDPDAPPSLTSSADQPLFTLPNLGAGKTVARCISVTYVGGKPAAVKLYATQGGTGLADHLDLRVTRGLAPAANGSCTGFRPDHTDYAGAGPGVLYQGSLAAFPAHSGVALSPGAPWQSGETHTYRISLSVASDEAAAGLSAFFDFIWGAEP